MVKKSLMQTVADPTQIDEKTVDLYWELLRYPGNRRATTLRAAAGFEDEYIKELPKISTPTLILWGEEDNLIYLDSGHIFDEKIPNSTLTVYPGIGHIPMEEIPERVSDDIDAFLHTVKEQEDELTQTSTPERGGED
jgi:pimeloyl-ACP methyl ester carboxylesterase